MMFRFLVLSVLVCVCSLWPSSSPCAVLGVSLPPCSNPFDTLFFTIGRELPPGTSGDFITALERQDVDPLRRRLMDFNQRSTVFAFTDQAWSASGLSRDLRADYISTVMSYHIMDGILTTTELLNQTYFMETLANDPHYVTLGGKAQVLGIKKHGNNISVNFGADSLSVFGGRAHINPELANIPACNGIIHVVDRVLRPPTLLSDSLTKTLNSTSFIFATLKSIPPTYLDLLDEPPRYTVFAPTDTAFAAVDNFHSIDSTAWSTILSSHIVPNNILFSINMTVGQEIKTLAGTHLKVTQNGPQGLFINGVLVNEPDIITQTGVLHLIDSVFKPDIATSQY